MKMDQNRSSDQCFRVFILKDDKSATYGMPITSPTRGMFIRELQEELSRGNAIFARHPQDFSIFEVGQYDPRTGELTMYESKTCLGLVQDLRSSLDETKN